MAQKSVRTQLVTSIDILPKILSQKLSASLSFETLFFPILNPGVVLQNDCLTGSSCSWLTWARNRATILEKPCITHVQCVPYIRMTHFELASTQKCIECINIKSYICISENWSKAKDLYTKMSVTDGCVDRQSYLKSKLTHLKFKK